MPSATHMSFIPPLPTLFISLLPTCTLSRRDAEAAGVLPPLTCVILEPPIPKVPPNCCPPPNTQGTPASWRGPTTRSTPASLHGAQAAERRYATCCLFSDVHGRSFRDCAVPRPTARQQHCMMHKQQNVGTPHAAYNQMFTGGPSKIVRSHDPQHASITARCTSSRT